MGRTYSGRQRSGGQFSGVSTQNTVQPRDSWEDLSASDKARLIKITGQDADPLAIARDRHFHGQAGKQPPPPLPSRYSG